MRGLLAALLILSIAAPLQAQVPIPNNDTRSLFLSLVGDKPFGQATLTGLEGTLANYCIALTPPNAAGDRTKIYDPVTHNWTRVGFGEGHWVWIPQGVAEAPPCSVAPPSQPPAPPALDLSAIYLRLDQLANRLDHQFERIEELAANNVAEHHATQAEIRQHDENPSWLRKVFTNPTVLAVIGALAAGKFAIPGGK